MSKLGLGLTALALAGATAVTCATISDKDKQNNELKESNTQLEVIIDNQKDELLFEKTSHEHTKSELKNSLTENAKLKEELARVKNNMPKLNAPTIDIFGYRLEISDCENGPFKGTYSLYKNGEYFQTIIADSDGYAQIYEFGDDYTLSVCAAYPGFNKSDFSNEIKIPKNYFPKSYGMPLLSISSSGECSVVSTDIIRGIHPSNFSYEIRASDKSSVVTTGVIGCEGSTTFLSNEIFAELNPGQYYIFIKACASASFEDSSSSYHPFKKCEDGSITSATLDPVVISAEGRSITIVSNGFNCSGSYEIFDDSNNLLTDVSGIEIGGSIDLTDFCSENESLNVFIVPVRYSLFARGNPSNTVKIKGPNYVEGGDTGLIDTEQPFPQFDD